MKTHYDTLNLTPSATDDEIKQAYRALARVHHPDAGGTAERMSAISEAYRVLSKERAQYDATLILRQTALCPECRGAGMTVIFKKFLPIPVVCTTCGGVGRVTI